MTIPDPSRFYRLAEYVFNRHFFEHGNAAADRNDIIQAAMLRLTLDMRRVPDADWESLAPQCLRRGMQDEFRRIDPLGRGHREDVRNGTEAEPPTFFLVEQLEQRSHPQDRDTLELVSEFQEAEILWRTISTLPERQRQLIIGLLDERKQRDVAAEIGVTESRFCQLKNKTFSTLRVRLTARGIHR